MKYPTGRKREWVAKLKAEGLTKKKPTGESEETSALKVLPQGAWLWMMFVYLNAHRQQGPNGPQPIMISDMWAYAQIEELDGGECRWALEVMSELDRVFLEETYKKIEEANKKRATKGKGASPGRGRR